MIRPMKIPRSEARPLTVDEVAARVKRLIDFDEVLSRVVVEGELTDLKRHVSGHVYFALKGRASVLNGVMFKSDAGGILMWPQVGDRVLVSGSVRLYEGRGTVQIYARKMYPLGQSAAARAKEELRRRLEAEGLFAAGRKRSLPRYPRVVACVTSDTGAAIRDVMRQHAVRWPSAKLILVPCLVQGVHAAESAALALRRAGMLGAEVVLLVRGGGAKEDLNPFDDEELVREVARCPVPVVTGVGHEIDESLCDLASDLCQPTPTAAAAAVFPDRKTELGMCEGAGLRIKTLAVRRLEDSRTRVENCSSRIGRSAERALQNALLNLESLSVRISRHAKSSIAAASVYLDGAARTLSGLSPRSLARRGYSLVGCGGKPLLSVTQIETDSQLTVQLLDGDVVARSERVVPRG